MRNGGLNAKLRQISEKLSDIIENDSDEKVMVFTDNRALQELCSQINSLLSDRHFGIFGNDAPCGRTE